MVLRTIHHATIQGTGYNSHLQKCSSATTLVLNVDGDDVVRSWLQESVVLLLSELVLLKVVVVAQEGSSSLKVDTCIILLHLSQLVLLGLDSGLQRCYLGAKAHNSSILLGTLQAKLLAILGKLLDGIGMRCQSKVSLVGLHAGIVQILLRVVQHEVQMLSMVPQLRVRLQLHGYSCGITPHKVSIARRK